MAVLDLHPQGNLASISWTTTDKAPIKRLSGSKHEKLVDVLVNNVGISLGISSVVKGNESTKALHGRLLSMDQAEWEAVYRIIVVGYVL
ncbi:hypothetical protein SCP_0213220 [Sparassis crispa]|uniref:Ketoreductase (KR) domain-containing protein n=1 Tax=Sparassis crispa TaxID=139825 RepID=A0A401GD56_9APHY|nr:hypothetical protein SCP_0213220 [Sparassis crispa]GBE80119.1 hypothetical protein SCP_0213220 [Sparassis crispa]